MATRIDLETLARKERREQFIASCPFPLLVAQHAIEEHEGPSPTLVMTDFSNVASRRKPRQEDTGSVPVAAAGAMGAPSTAHRRRTLGVLGVCKTQENFPRMISVGRTANNDLVVPDVTVSKFHAYFREIPGTPRFELIDAGSRNGTWVQGRRVPVRTTALPIAPGDMVRFGQVEMLVVDAGTCWDLLNRRRSGAASDF